jgi:hypothetical protein
MAKEPLKIESWIFRDGDKAPVRRVKKHFAMPSLVVLDCHQVNGPKSQWGREVSLELSDREAYELAVRLLTIVDKSGVPAEGDSRLSFLCEAVERAMYGAKLCRHCGRLKGPFGGRRECWEEQPQPEYQI